MDLPAYLRTIVDKTALHVAENGPDFEKRILANQAGNRAFDFLLPGDPSRDYYQRKVVEFRMELQAPAPIQRVVSGAPAGPPEGCSASYYQRSTEDFWGEFWMQVLPTPPSEGSAALPEGWW